MVFRVLLFLLPCASAYAQQTLTPSLADWKAAGGTITEKMHTGRNALVLSRGMAYLPASRLRNGTVDVDIAPGVPGMAGIVFHANDRHDYEVVYIRHFKSGNADALQYSPEFKGELSWQFYPEYEAKVTYPNDWVHLQVRIKDGRARAYVLNSDTAVLDVDSLRIPERQGYVGLWALTETYFSNFRYTQDEPAQEQKSFPSKLVANPKAIKEWLVSNPVLFSREGAAAFNEKTAGTFQWQKATTEADGFLNINPLVKKNIGEQGFRNSNDMVWLVYESNEKEPATKAFRFEFSNQCFLFLNGRRIFSGDNSFMLNPFFTGQVDKALRVRTVYLDLKKGKNVIAVAVASVSNGWGFMAQME